MKSLFSNQFNVIYDLDKHKLFWAIDKNNIDLLNEMIIQEENNVEFLTTKNVRGLTALHYAVTFCKFETLDFLLSKAGHSLINITDNRRNTLLHTAININNPRKVQALIDYKPNLKLKNHEELTPIGLAKKIENLDRRIRCSLSVYIKEFKKTLRSNSL